jgi:hypothetical protein
VLGPLQLLGGGLVLGSVLVLHARRPRLGRRRSAAA